MLTVEKNLVRWRTFYGELCEAEQRLRQAQADRGSCGASTVEMEREVRELQERCEGALDEVGAALAARRNRQADADSAASPQPH